LKAQVGLNVAINTLSKQIQANSSKFKQIQANSSKFKQILKQDAIEWRLQENSR